MIGGIISGLPLGTGLSIYFISYEQGIDFTAKGIPFGIAGLSASIVFCLVYLLISRSGFSINRYIVMIYSSLISLISFIIFGYCIYLVNVTLLQGTAIFIIVFILNLFIIKRLINLQEPKIKSKSTLLQILVRGIAVGVILLIITGISSIAGSQWAGILSAFPSTLFPLLLVLHYEEGNKLFPHVIYGFSYSISTLVLFYYSYLFFIPLYGLNLGFLMIYGICVVYLFLFRKIQLRIENIRR